ncbi:DNA polymerase III subunit delta [Sphingomonas mesophila]|uniref:DNA polymerase III subunit delta n=1 Tax=Sphingomonas mesophila TaxID=2303576 RepID=UPI000E56F94C|nr:DNA polymerase III subunit delta [Sphingomonas mesophila]
MIVKPAAVGAKLDRPDLAIRFYLFHGPDESGSRALGARLLAALGADKFALAASAVKEDPASLPDEASAMALFGGPRAIWIEPAGDEIAPGVAALLDAAVTESVVVAIAGTLKKTGALLKLADAHAAALSSASYAPEGGNAVRLVLELARAEGLAANRAVAERVADEAGGNGAVIASELAKFALYLDSTPERPRTLTHEVVDALGCGGEGDVQRLGDLALDGDLAALLEEIDRSGLAAKDGVSVLRALQRRLLAVIPLRARIAEGERSAAVMASAGRAIFWKEKELVERMLRTWPPERLARLVERTAEIERALMLSDAPEVASIGEHLVTVARVAQRAR